MKIQVTRAPSTSTTPAPITPTEAPKPAAPAEKTVSAPAPAATAAGWTEVEEQTLWDMKQQSKSWKEIEEAIPGKERGVMKERYRTLSEAKQKEKGEGEKKVEEKKDKEEERKAGDGRNNAKEGEKGGKGEDDKSEGGKKSSMKERKEKKDDAVGAGGEIKKVGDRPVIYLDEGDQLDAGQACHSLHFFSFSFSFLLIEMVFTER